MAEHRFKKLCILVVDDYAPLRIALHDILEAEGYAVLVANDGVHALEVLHSTQDNGFPDLVLSDIAMPRMDGYALCEAIRERAEWAALPLIFLTAMAEAADKAESQCAVAYIAKPFEPEGLLAAIARYAGATAVCETLRPVGALA